MKILIAEDDLASRRLIYKFLSSYGNCDITVDGIETLEAFLMALDEGEPYDLVCLDIMMPKVDGIKVLATIRELENQKKVIASKRVKVIMMTALNDMDTVNTSFNTGCEAYAAKPINLVKLVEVMKKLKLID